MRRRPGDNAPVQINGERCLKSLRQQSSAGNEELFGDVVSEMELPPFLSRIGGQGHDVGIFDNLDEPIGDDRRKDVVAWALPYDLTTGRLNGHEIRVAAEIEYSRLQIRDGRGPRILPVQKFARDCMHRRQHFTCARFTIDGQLPYHHHT